MSNGPRGGLERRSVPRTLAAALVVAAGFACLSWSQLALRAFEGDWPALPWAAILLATISIPAACLFAATPSPEKKYVAAAGGLGLFAWWNIGPILLVGLVSLLGFVVAAIAALWRRNRRRMLKACAFFAAVVAGTWAGVPLGTRTVLDRLSRVPARAEALVRAIHSYEKENGRPPENLAGLVPRYIAAIPSTGMRNSVGLYQVPGEGWDEGRLGSNSWALRTWVGWRFGSHEVIYLPNHQYPAGMRRVTDWAVQ